MAGGAGPKESSSEAIVRDIVRGIYEGRYVPGQRLVEPDLMTQYGVSRSTVREVIKQLSADGIAVSHPFRGAQIRKLDRRAASNIFAVTEVVLGLAARQAAAHSAEAGVKTKLRQCLADIKTCAKRPDGFEFIRSRNRFYRAVAEVSGNDELLRLLPKLQVHLVRNPSGMASGARIQGYGKITKAILSGDQDGAEDAARAYVRDSAELALPQFPEH